ncbi:hypothetical protein N868_08965 [Cellulomonas carbonis T26]|uniref:Uncharacterized protein n=1 Tax=Cellulomonas carbonis T26 TaxID=947969 RepID=A0A0A0BKE5_9CELL|nr:hypothetical protein N868_08965 [Cellulomonas carbonis T26]
MYTIRHTAFCVPMPGTEVTMVNTSVSSSSDLISSEIRLSIFSTSLLSSDTICLPLCEIIVLIGDFSIVSFFSPLRT